ncbi:MAG: flavin reductase family protein [Erysipelotrichaceae bacterium]
MKKQINPFDYSNTITQTLKKGILVTASHDDKINPMTISWGMLGIQWNKPVFIVFIRKSRFTKKLLDINPNFTINIPIEDIHSSILVGCGTKSGRDIDKIKTFQLTPVKASSINGYALKEFPLTLECKIIYQQAQLETQLSNEIIDRFYTKDADLHDYHIAYYGEIVDSYILGEHHV